ncbi:MAG: crotonobetainyl-CoA--carnitine CoA-transferase [Deltaproteobacteria bacterium]|nr:crotonobetainyl-CoA--carnitine CoA-transferase [Deltaproteobacteria bacterium]MBW2154107.1 crotonobetainyl-CoA--carnitine CoA-transferase [Deltaproteobacteria bacterium]
MLIQSKFQIDQKDYDFIKKFYKSLNYKSLSEYMREAVTRKVKEDRKKLRESKRKSAMEMIGRTKYENIFEPIEGDDFESR